MKRACEQTWTGESGVVAEDRWVVVTLARDEQAAAAMRTCLEEHEIPTLVSAPASGSASASLGRRGVLEVLVPGDFDLRASELLALLEAGSDQTVPLMQDDEEEDFDEMFEDEDDDDLDDDDDDFDDDDFDDDEDDDDFEEDDDVDV